LSSASYETLYKEIEKRLARKKHSDILKVIIDALREGGEEGVKEEIKTRLSSIIEEAT
jgi:hypothetical protein